MLLRLSFQPSCSNTREHPRVCRQAAHSSALRHLARPALAASCSANCRTFASAPGPALPATTAGGAPGARQENAREPAALRAPAHRWSTHTGLHFLGLTWQGAIRPRSRPDASPHSVIRSRSVPHAACRQHTTSRENTATGQHRSAHTRSGRSTHGTPVLCSGWGLTAASFCAALRRAWPARNGHYALRSRG
jgi:hypothetical protein